MYLPAHSQAQFSRDQFVWPAQASGAASAAGDKAAKAAKSGAAQAQKAADGAEREAQKAADGAKREAGAAGEAASQVRFLLSAWNLGRGGAASIALLHRRFTVSCS